MVLVNSEGKVAMKYRKMMPWCPKEPWTPGETMNVCEGPKKFKNRYDVMFGYGLS